LLAKEAYYNLIKINGSKFNGRKFGVTNEIPIKSKESGERTESKIIGWLETKVQISLCPNTIERKRTAVLIHRNSNISKPTQKCHCNGP
jgi:hypothetical protein